MPSSVTVAIPTRDRPQFLHRALSSVLSGSLRPDRVVVVDNSQRDPSATRQICEQFDQVEYAAPIGDLTLQGNQNRALECGAPTTFVCVLHDDDVYGPRFLERGVAALSADPSANVFCVNYGVIDADDRPLNSRAWAGWFAGVHEPKVFLSHILSTTSPIHLSASMLRSGPAARCRMVEIDGACFDAGFFLQLGATGRVIMCDEPLVAIRLHQAMVSVAAGFKQKEAAERKSEELGYVSLEWPMKLRFLDSRPAQEVLGGELQQIKRAAARYAVRRLRPDLRGDLPIAERWRVFRMIASILPEAV